MKLNKGSVLLTDTGLGAGASRGAGEDGHVESLSSPLPCPKSEDQSVTRSTVGNVERAARACDSCRKMKIRCNGVRPCKHCMACFYSESLSASITCSLALTNGC
jgi:hypothetical protein